jgi:hypothetical protein
MMMNLVSGINQKLRQSNAGGGLGSALAAVVGKRMSVKVARPEPSDEERAQIITERYGEMINSTDAEVSKELRDILIQ